MSEGRRHTQTVNARIPVDANRLARAMAGLTGVGKPEVIGRAIRELCEREFPEVVARLARNRPKGKKDEP